MIRLARTSDAGALLAIYAHQVEVGVATFEIEPPSLGDFEARIAQTLRGWPWLVFEEQGVAVGYAYASGHRSRAAYQWTVEVSVYVREDFHKRGVGRALYGVLFEVLRHQGFAVALAGITLPNAGSVRLHESMGFEPVGVYKAVGFKFGAWRDVGWWSLNLGSRAGGSPGLVEVVEMSEVLAIPGPLATPPSPVPLEALAMTAALKVLLGES